MVLNNSKIAAWLAALAECGIESIRIGTKEMAFYPKRFDETFLAMLDAFHESYPDVGVHFMVHFEHPDEFLVKDDNGNYVQDEYGIYKWVPDTHAAMTGLLARGWITVENQTPIIRDINDDPDALRIMQREIKRVAPTTITSSAAGTSSRTKRSTSRSRRRGRSSTNRRRACRASRHARLSITHYKGKTEVVAVTNEPIPGLPGAENGVVIFKILRNAGSAPDRCKVCIVGRNPKAIWFNDYEDRVLFDEAGLYDYARVQDAKTLAAAR